MLITALLSILALSTGTFLKFLFTPLNHFARFSTAASFKGLQAFFQPPHPPLPFQSLVITISRLGGVCARKELPLMSVSNLFTERQAQQWSHNCDLSSSAVQTCRTNLSLQTHSCECFERTVLFQKRSCSAL